MSTEQKTGNTISDVLSIAIEVNGKAISDSYQLLDIQACHELDQVSFAEVVISGGQAGTDASPVIDNTDLSIGSELVIRAGYGSSPLSTIFKGVIVKQGLEMTEGAFNFRILCKHKVVATTFNRSDAEFSKRTDSAIIKSILNGYSGITVTVEDSLAVQEHLFQKQTTDWDLIRSRANFLGFVIAMDGDSVTIGKPNLTADPALKVAAGESMLSFNAALDAEQQYPAVDAMAWDPNTQSLIKRTAVEPVLNAQGDASRSGLSKTLDQKDLTLVSTTPMETDELQTWANGRLLRARLSALQGSVSFAGSGLVRTGSIIELAGVGNKFSGKAFVSAVHQVIKDGTWTTTAKFGLDTAVIEELPKTKDLDIAAQLPPIKGLHVAKVKQISQDPESGYRVLVNIPSGASQQNGFWARLSSWYATSGAGAFFYPEVDDEVIVGFLEDDPRYPIILGSVYSSKMRSPVEPTDNNNIKALVTRSRLKLSFDDEKKIITITTPAGNTLCLNDDAKYIDIKDQNDNEIKLSSSGISISSYNDVTINGRNIKLTATGNISLSAQGDVTAKGLNVALTANIGFAGKGATAEVSGTGQTTIKGGIVMIN